MFSLLKTKIRNLFFPDIKFTSYKFKGKLEKLGSAYGGWTIPTELINTDSICYLAGAGEDISFDVSLAERFHCRVFIFDPTPKAKIHFEKVKETAINDRQPFIKYLQFNEIGIWHKTEVLKFFAPKDESHVSHSISNLQQTTKYFEAPVKSLMDIMESEQHNQLDILKLDIEGAEFDVIDSIVQNRINIKILCVEFHKQKEKGFMQIQSTINKLEEHDYFVIAREALDFTFINKKWLN